MTPYILALTLIFCPLPTRTEAPDRQIASPAKERLRTVFPEKVTRRPRLDFDAPPERMLNDGRSYPPLTDGQGAPVFEYEADPLELIAELLAKIEELEARIDVLEAQR